MGMIEPRPEDIRRVMRLYVEFYLDIGDPSLIGRGFPGFDGFSEQLWALTRGGQRCQDRNHEGFDVLTVEFQRWWKDEVKTATIWDCYGQATIRRLNFADDKPPAFDRLIVIVPTVPFGIDYAVLVPYALAKKLASKRGDPRTLTVARSWTRREGIEDVTAECRTVIRDLMAGE